MQLKIFVLRMTEDDILNLLVKGMLRKFEKYWGKFEKINYLLLLAVILDPCYKIKYVKCWFNKAYDERVVVELIGSIKTKFASLFNW